MKHSTDSSGSKPILRGTQAVWYILGIIEILLGLRFLLKLLGANPAAAFTSFVYGVSYPLALPFINVFRISASDGGRSILEWPTLLAMLIYWLIAWGIIRLFLNVRPVSETEAAARLDEQERDV